MIIFFVDSVGKNKSFYLDVNPNEKIIDILKKNNIIDFEHLKSFIKKKVYLTKIFFVSSLISIIWMTI